MLGAPSFFLGLLCVCGAPPSGPAISPAAFQEWFETSSRGALHVPGPVEQRAQRFRFVFVAGFANERMPGYFSQCAQELRAHGVSREAIQFINPSSHRSFDENYDGMKARFMEIASQGPEPLVVIAHSRGASDTLAFALQNPDFVHEHVHALFLVQGAFGGTPAADYVLGEGTPMDRQMPLRLRALGHTMGRFERRAINKGKHDGLSGLTRNESKDFWERIQEEHACAIPVVGPKTFYVTSQVEPSQLRLFHKAIGTYLGTYYGPNDGVVVLDDQSLPGIGTRLAVLEAGHTAFTHRFPATGAPRRLRRALVESIIMAIDHLERPSDMSQGFRPEDREQNAAGADGKGSRSDLDERVPKRAARRGR